MYFIVYMLFIVLLMVQIKYYLNQVSAFMLSCCYFHFLFLVTGGTWKSHFKNVFFFSFHCFTVLSNAYRFSLRPCLSADEYNLPVRHCLLNILQAWTARSKKSFRFKKVISFFSSKLCFGYMHFSINENDTSLQSNIICGNVRILHGCTNTSDLFSSLLLMEQSFAFYLIHGIHAD